MWGFGGPVFAGGRGGVAVAMIPPVAGVAGCTMDAEDEEEEEVPVVPGVIGVVLASLVPRTTLLSSARVVVAIEVLGGML